MRHYPLQRHILPYDMLHSAERAFLHYLPVMPYRIVPAVHSGVQALAADSNGLLHVRIHSFAARSIPARNSIITIS